MPEIRKESIFQSPYKAYYHRSSLLLVRCTSLLWACPMPSTRASTWTTQNTQNRKFHLLLIIANLQEAEKQQTHHQARLLSLNCTKCSYNAVENLLWEDDIYWFYNRANLHGYTKDGQHFTPEFLKKLKPMYQKAIDEVLKRLELEDKH